MEVLDDIKTLKNISLTDTSQDGSLNIYIRRAETAISKYFNNSLDNATIETMYPDAVITYVIEHLNKKGNEGIKQYSQGSRSGIYEGSGLSNDVKSLLPLPHVRMM